MKALIVYESMFGNTEDIAQAIAKGIGGNRRSGSG
jgi:flavodoxin